MDHIIREAADKHHPAYNDSAWEKMEKKLDKHLPQKKDRRKFIFFLLFFLLLGGGAFFSIIYFSDDGKEVSREIAESKTGKQSNTESGNKKTTTGVTDGAVPDSETGTITGQVEIAPGPDQPGIQLQDKKNNVDVVGKSRKKSSKGKYAVGIIPAVAADELTKEKGENIKDKQPQKKNTAARKNVVITATSPESDETEDMMIPVTAADSKITDSGNDEKKETVKAVEDKKEKDIKTVDNTPPSAPDKKKPKKNIAGNFGLTFSAGPDLSFVELNKLGKATLTYGAGLSYNFGKRITVRTGFYFSKKIYTAEPDQYHPPGGNYPYLYEVAADCKLYEIPVSVSYNFWQKKNHNWFGSAGLSSFLMKKEYYNYIYKTPYGQTYSYPKTVNNENKHYFSVLTLSAGYQYHFSKRISLQAEPFVKLPLGGIGLGKIKLNSSGVLFTLTVKPFAKK